MDEYPCSRAHVHTHACMRAHTHTKGRGVNDFISYYPRQKVMFPFILPSVTLIKVQSYLILRCVLVSTLDNFPRQVVHFSQSDFLGPICSYCLLFGVKGDFGRSVWSLH